MGTSVTIGGLARQSAVHVETIRYYQQRGLLDEPARPPGGVRRYTADHVRRLSFIRRARDLGFSLDEVGELLRLEDGTDCRAARALGERRLADVRSKLADLRRIETLLADLTTRCGSTSARVRCPLVDSLLATPAVAPPPLPLADAKRLRRKPETRRCAGVAARGTSA
jgi:MerR family mercuric resistance operon transcriptional regulator